MNSLRPIFVEKLYEVYEVNSNLGRFLYDRWKCEKLTSEKEINDFILSEDVKKVFFPVPDINITKNYTQKQLDDLGIKFVKILDKNKREYLDSKYGFTWAEQYSGFGESYTGLYKVISPHPQDEHLTG